MNFSRCFLLLYLVFGNPAEKPLLGYAGILPDPVVGYPYIKYYGATDYQAHTQNWGIVQDSMGVLYFANGNGLLLFNGSDWQLIELPGQSMAASVGIDAGQVVYVGGWGTFGRIVYRPDGMAVYEALSDLLGPESEKLSRVYETVTSADGVYFRTGEAIYRYRPGQPIQTWYMGEKQLGKLIQVNDRLFLKWQGRGIAELVDDQWKLLPDTDRFKDEFVHSIMPYDHGRLLVAVNSASLYLYDGHRFTEFESEATPYFRKHRIYCAVRTIEGEFLFGTVSGGLMGIDHQGRISLQISDSGLLPNLSIRNFLIDRHQNLWLALDAGIALMEYPSPFTIFRLKQKKAKVTAFARVHNRLYAATNEGLLQYQKLPSRQEAFGSVPEFSHKVWGLEVFNNQLLVANEYGIHEWRPYESVTIKAGKTPGMQLSGIDPRRLYVFLENGLTTLVYDNGSWREEQVLPGFNRRVSKVVEQNAKTIWLDTDWAELWSVTFSSDTGIFHWNDVRLIRYDTSQGLPPERGKLYKIDSLIYFVPRSLSANYRWDDKRHRFEIDTQLYRVLDIPYKDIVIWAMDNRHHCWYVRDYGTNRESLGVSLKGADGRYHHADVDFGRILNDAGSTFFVEGDTIWHGGFGSIVHHEITSNRFVTDYQALIRQVVFQTDSILAYGHNNRLVPSLRYQQNAIRFHYGATEFVLPESLSFQSMLEGYDTDWSPWTRDTQRQYFGLAPGSYIFRVRASNSENRISRESHYSFDILTPWYRQWWAYLLYTFCGTILVGGLVHWRSAALRREKRKLELLVRQRTEEVEIRNKQLEEQKTTLVDQAQRLLDLDQLKTNLFANISHEFRTPLTLIKGPVDQIVSDGKKGLSSDEAAMIKRNADRLLRLVNQLLDLAKLDARSLELDFTEGDIFRFFRVQASSFSSMAAQMKIDYQIRIPSYQLWSTFDRDKLESVIYNLLNNAFKFTPSGGKIAMIVDHADHRVQVTVRDNGPGIAPENLNRVFDRFYQVDPAGTTTRSGSGIGLALCRELIDLMNGQITVKSTLNKGSTFSFWIPLEEIIDGSMNDLFQDINPANAHHLESNTGNGLTTANQKDGAEIILIVEDHPEMRRYIRTVLEAEFSVLEAENGREGFNLAVKEIPDLVITDTMMPSMDGHEFSRTLKTDQRTSHIPVIMLTAKATLENKLVGLSAGIDSYLTKPFNAAELMANVKALLTERKRLRKLFARQLLIGPREVEVSSLDQQFLDKLLEVLERHHGDPTFGVPQMQVVLVMSKTQLHRKLTAITNQSPGEFLRNFRLQRAAQILVQKGETVTQVAYAVGFENLPYFTKCFKDLFGVVPSRYGKESNDKAEINP